MAELFKIWWILNNVVKEEIFKDRPVPKHVAEKESQLRKRTTHKTGKLVIVPASSDPRSVVPQKRLFTKEQERRARYDDMLSNPSLFPELEEDY